MDTIEQDEQNRTNPEKNTTDSHQSSGDKRDPMASGGGSSSSESVRREAAQPGGEKNAAGETQSNTQTQGEGYKSRIGSQPIPDDLLKKGDQ